MIHWNADPEAFSFGFLTIRWYGIVFAAGFLSGYRIMQWIFILLLTMYRLDAHRLHRGLLTGAFLVSVFFVRILLETVKTHQAFFTPIFNLRMVQLLSIPFVLLGIVLVVRSRSGL